MSAITKTKLLKSVEEKMVNELTAAQLQRVMNLLADELGFYEVEECEEGKPDTATEELLQIYITAKRLEGRSEKTLKAYTYMLRRLFKWINTPIRQITVFQLRAYLMKERERGISDRTLEGARSTFCAFFGWLHKEGLMSANPCVNLGVIKCAKKVREPYSAVEVEKLKEACDNDRDKAIISFLASTGCRISEMCELNRDAIDFNNLECVVHGKGDKERTVFIDNVAAMYLRRYLKSRDDLSGALFVGRGTERMTPGGVRARLNRIAGRAGVINVHPHRFRRTLATSLIDRGMPIQDVAYILGHDKLDTTMRYVFLDKTNVRNEYRKYV